MSQAMSCFQQGERFVDISTLVIRYQQQSIKSLLLCYSMSQARSSSQQGEQYADFLRASRHFKLIALGDRRHDELPTPKKIGPFLACPLQQLLPAITDDSPYVLFPAVTSPFRLKTRDGDHYEDNDDDDDLPDLVDEDYDWAQDFTAPHTATSTASYERSPDISISYDVVCQCQAVAQIRAKL
ncbi:hypothetical protein C8J57DRAFT_1715928 [Mycena rebaudengoi]|nr:hypothetical protein C8J57DRAFT_1715928 [Mycena rebaudengoi]